MSETKQHPPRLSEAADIIKVAQAAITPVPIATTADNLLFVPASGVRPSEVVDIETIRTPLRPRRKVGTVNVFNVDSFNAFIAHNKDAGDVFIYADGDVKSLGIVAVLNDNGDSGPGHRDFRCAIRFRWTAEWLKWKAIDGKMLPQADFAEFIEENLADIHAPAGAQMLEIATYLQATRSVDFKSALNLSNGNVQFQNVESLDAKVSASVLTVPTEITLGIAPIYGSKPFKIPARFRYRLSEGKLSLGIKLLRIEDVIAKIFDEAVAEIVTGDGIILLSGTP